MNTSYDATRSEVRLLQDFRVPMRDGILLATDVYMPQGSGPWPVVIERTPYDKSGFSRSEIQLDGHRLSRRDMAQRFADEGFVTVFQDCRGRYQSEGAFIKYINEAEDGYDTLAWIIKQPWCDGHIGSMGLSYAAHTQMAMACLNPPGLMTMVLDSGGFANAFQCGIRQGGAFELKQATWAYGQALESPEAQSCPELMRALQSEDLKAWFGRMPWRPHDSPVRHIPDYEDYLFEQWRHGNFDDYWKKIGLYAQGYYSDIPDIPVLFMSSWYDAYVSSTLTNFEAFCSTKRSPQRLIMGPWLHGDRNVTHSGNAEFGPLAGFDKQVADNWLSCRIDWFKQWLKAEHRDVTIRHDVDVFMMGGGEGTKDGNGRLVHGGHWIKSDRWPLADSEQTMFYLASNGGLVRNATDTPDACVSFYSDPNNPVPTIGGALTSGAPVFFGGAFDQVAGPGFFGGSESATPLSNRSDVLSFQTEPLQEDIFIAGHVQVELWVETTARDTDFTAKLIDVYPASTDYPSGYAMNITDGIFRCRYRNSWTTPELIEEGEVFKIVIEPFATCNLFKRGHRLRIDIAGSNFPRFDVNPNSGEAEGHAENKVVAKSTIHLSRRYPSRLSVTCKFPANQ